MYIPYSKRRPGLAIFVAALGISASLRADPATSTTVEKPFVEDEFAGATRSSLWDFRTGFDGVGFNVESALVFGTMDGARTIVKIVGKQEALTASGGVPFTCGGLVGTFVPKYGYYEISAKYPSAPGWHGAFWVGGKNEIDGPEMDSGSGNRTADYSSHYWPAANATQRVGHLGWALDFKTSPTEGDGRVEKITVNPSAAYRQYGFEWTPSHIFFYIDGVLKATTRYPGPHHPDNVLHISNLAYNSHGEDLQSPGELLVDYFRYYRRNYGFTDWKSTSLNYALPLGDSTFAYSRNALDPDQAFATAGNQHVISSNDFTAEAHWDFPASTTPSTQRYEVFVWNPSVFPSSYLSADIPANPGDAQGNPGGMFIDYHIYEGSTPTTGTPTQTVSFDQVYAGQSWLGLGTRSFTGAKASAIKAEVQISSAQPLWPLRAGPMLFRPLLRYDEFSTGSLSASLWQQEMGTWGVVSGTAANSGTTESVLLRAPADGFSMSDGIVRARMDRPSSGTVASSTGLVARFNSSTRAHYLLRINHAASKIGLLKYTGSAYVVIADTVLPPGMSLTGPQEVVFVLKTTATNDVDLLGFVAGRPVVAATDYNGDSPILAAGQVGVRAYGGVAYFDNLGAGN